MAAETPAQKKLLAQIADTAEVVDALKQDLDYNRAQLAEQMAQAKDDLKISSYRISEAAKISQPRVMQIIKAAKGQGTTGPKRPSHKQLLDEVSSLRHQLQEAQDQLENQGGEPDAVSDS
jgi:hypothetical protein